LKLGVGVKLTKTLTDEQNIGAETAACRGANDRDFERDRSHLLLLPFGDVSTNLTV